jgi:hypothetical protein
MRAQRPVRLAAATPGRGTRKSKASTQGHRGEKESAAFIRDHTCQLSACAQVAENLFCHAGLDPASNVFERRWILDHLAPCANPE